MRISAMAAPERARFVTDKAVPHPVDKAGAGQQPQRDESVDGDSRDGLDVPQRAQWRKPTRPPPRQKPSRYAAVAPHRGGAAQQAVHDRQSGPDRVIGGLCGGGPTQGLLEVVENQTRFAGAGLLFLGVHSVHPSRFAPPTLDIEACGQVLLGPPDC